MRSICITWLYRSCSVFFIYCYSFCGVLILHLSVQVIQTHFWIKRNEIMQTVANWITELEGQSGDERTQRTIQLNLMALKVIASYIFL